MDLYNDYEDTKDAELPPLDTYKSNILVSKEITKEQHFTQPPAHFTEASLVKTLEELGIGRPSTYVPTISTILSREYVVREKKNFVQN